MKRSTVSQLNVNAWKFLPLEGDCLCQTLLANEDVCRYKDSLKTPIGQIENDLGIPEDTDEAIRFLIIDKIATCGISKLANFINPFDFKRSSCI